MAKVEVETAEPSNVQTSWKNFEIGTLFTSIHGVVFLVIEGGGEPYGGELYEKYALNVRSQRIAPNPVGSVFTALPEGSKVTFEQ